MLEFPEMTCLLKEDFKKYKNFLSLSLSPFIKKYCPTEQLLFGRLHDQISTLFLS